VTQAAGGEQFVQLLIKAQTRLYAFILSLVGDRTQADDVLQETNMVLWRKAEEFEPGTDFGAWACQVAYFQVLAHWQRDRRERLLFDEELMRVVAGVIEQRTSEIDERKEALRACLSELPDPQRDLLHRRYNLDNSIKQIAADLGRPDGSIAQTLYRIRATLLSCIERRLHESPSGQGEVSFAT